jgi:hypothetical protein
VPCDYSKYPADWKEIRARILTRAQHCCEFCGAANYKPHPRTGKRVVLTVAHLDHDLTHNEDENLRALCQPCHLAYDAEHHAETRRKKRISQGEEDMADLLYAEGIGYRREYHFHPLRKWRFDFAVFTQSGIQVAIEVEGGAFSGGRHTRGAGFEGDCDKYNEAALADWLVLRVTPKMIKDGRALAWIKQALYRS